jgi:hypothetical protein
MVGDLLGAHIILKKKFLKEKEVVKLNIIKNKKFFSGHIPSTILVDL